ncbi:hypothetical protein [Microbacterium stercoris]|uniref:Uncharacterized protein n=1 Tax=Microbacterium stercoris TaxID=2820289 RepID=A0A939QNW9_9MICO|nr:hypothetical protein [Microbacterium stercoris]MBO3664105.1 hypothetical protein [Microbacterium stercoris]
MSTPDETSRPLTRRQLRELKLTGQTPVITADDLRAAEAARGEGEAIATADARAAEEARLAEEARAAEQAHAAEEARLADETRAAEEAAALTAAAQETSAPLPFAPADGGPRLTRREIREIERLRTNQVAVVTPEQAEEAAVAAERGEVDGDIDTNPHLAAIQTKVVGESETSVLYEVVEVPFFEETPEAEPATPSAELVFEDHDVDPVAEAAADADAAEAQATDHDAEHPRPEEQFADAAVETLFVAEDAPIEAAISEVATPSEAPDERHVVAPGFGAAVLDTPASSDAPSSFEEILSQAAADSSGSAAASSALILATDPGSIPLSAPIDATGEILITRTHQLPDGYGSTGHAAGSTDGKDVDVVLIDGEIPLASSPTPIAATNAVSTSKSPAEVIRPPAPEKSHRLTLILGITAGVLGIALIGVVVAAFTTGVLG